jgi:hypothetical protein
MAIFVNPTFRSISPDAEILEVGGGYNPRFRRPLYQNVRHLDHLSREGLIEKYAQDPHAYKLISNIEHIDYVCSGENISTAVGDKKFNIVYSRHALEHQVNLISHFESIEAILYDQGCLILEIPYISACFDMFRFPTTTGDVVCQNLENRRFHYGKQVFDCFAQTASFNDGRLPSPFDRIFLKISNDINLAYQKTTESMLEETKYQDSHAWTFTPTSFHLLMVELALLNLSKLHVDFVTHPYGNTFMACLSRDAGRNNSQDLLKKRLQLTKRLYKKLV